MSKRVKDCPAADDLQGFLLGSLGDTEHQSVELHLNVCASCSRLLSGLVGHDNLVLSLRRSREALPLPESLRDVIEKLKSIPTPNIEKIRLNSGDATPSVGQIDSPGAFSFLHPPDESGELGRLGPYRILAELGQGGMGVVFRAIDSQLERPVALKVIRPVLASDANARERFLREARAAAGLKHDHIVTIFQVGEDQGVAYLAMELLEGESLEARLGRQPVIPSEEARGIAVQIAEGLVAAHAKDCIHRDVKPDNIWLDSTTGRVKILDFGLARLAAGPGQQYRSHDGMILGTPAYMSPEQTRGEEALPASDLFSLGCVIYRMVTGRDAFHGNDVVGTLMAVSVSDPTPPHRLNPTISHEFSRLILRLLEKDPASRFHNARLAVETLCQIVPAAPPPSAVTVRWRWIASGSFVAAALFALTLAFWPRPQPAPDNNIVVAETPKRAIVPFDERNAESLQRAWANYHGTTIEIENDVGLTMVLIPPGEFRMGTTPEQAEHIQNKKTDIGKLKKDVTGREQPAHRVILTRPFRCAKTEVTVGQYRRFLEATGQNATSIKDLADNLPIVNVSWIDAAAFCNWLNELEHRPPCYQKNDFETWVLVRKDGYRLPTEAEWEFACRGGSETIYPFGDNNTRQNEFSWHLLMVNSLGGPQSVGTLKPNAFGLHDMLGNVFEFCNDWYAVTPYTDSDATDPLGPKIPDSNKNHRVIRGGGWQSPPLNCRSAFRVGFGQHGHDEAHGFRVIRGE